MRSTNKPARPTPAPVEDPWLITDTRVTIRLHSSLRKRVLAEARTKGITEAEVVRLALEAYLG